MPAMNSAVSRHRRNSNLLEDCMALEYILLGDLRDLLEETFDEHTQPWLVAVLDALLDALPREQHLKTNPGYLQEVLEEYPSWYRHVESLRHEHEDLYRNLRRLRDGVALRETFEEAADRARADLRDWMVALVAHHRHETRLIQTAINLEVGTGD
jgi:hypothetical protein